MSKVTHKLIVGLVWLLIITLAIGFYGIYLPQLRTQNEIWFFISLALFSLIFIMLVISYFKATCTQPGQPGMGLSQAYQQRNQLESIKQTTRERQNRRKQHRKNRHQEQDQAEINQQIYELQTQQYCFKCQKVRPARCHHCSICERCVLRMDHHCPWTGNCIGQNNHKYFILFLLYATVGLAFIGFNIIGDWINGRQVMQTLDEDWKLYACLAVGIASLLLMLSIGFLLFTQLMTISINLTTLETFTQGTMEKQPFNKGSALENFKDIFGVNGQYLLPTQPVFKFEAEQDYQIEHNF